jgi:hypothetical protein
MVKALPILLLFLFNFLVILLGAPLLYTLNVTLYRVLEPNLGRLLTTLIQATSSAFLVLIWLYFWRLIYHILFKRATERVSS